MKKNDEETEKRVCLGLLTHPLNIQKVQILFILFVVLNKISTFLFNTNEILNIFCIFAPV